MPTQKLLPLRLQLVRHQRHESLLTIQSGFSSLHVSYVRWGCWFYFQSSWVDWPLLRSISSHHRSVAFLIIPSLNLCTNYSWFGKSQSLATAIWQFLLCFKKIGLESEMCSLFVSLRVTARAYVCVQTGASARVCKIGGAGWWRLNLRKFVFSSTEWDEQRKMK